LKTNFLFFLVRHNGEFVVDGGYTDNAPRFDGNTITISPFSGEHDICPRDDSEIGALLNLSLSTGPTTSVALSMENMQRFRMAMIPPKPEDLLAVCRQGFDDTFEYLRSRNIIQCESCREEKLKLNLEKMQDWKRKPDASCLECDALFRDARLLNLPLDICEVFQEALDDMRMRNSGFVAAMSTIAISPYTLSKHVAIKSANIMQIIVPWESYFKAVLGLAPDFAACPFAS